MDELDGVTNRHKKKPSPIVVGLKKRGGGGGGDLLTVGKSEFIGEVEA